MRARWFILATFFFINVVAALAASQWVGAAVCGGIAFCLLALGLVEAAILRRGRRDQVPAASQEAIDALSALIALKDGPRDDAYEAAKSAAWQKGRDALSRLAAERLDAGAEVRR